jgi:hypothetical protein
MSDDQWGMAHVMAALLPDEAIDWSDAKLIKFWMDWRFEGGHITMPNVDEAKRAFRLRLMTQKAWDQIESD